MLSIAISEKANYNFSKVSDRDYLTFCSARPGFPDKDVKRKAVDEWIATIKEQNVTRVLILLGDDEKEYYKDMDIDAVMSEAFGDGNYLRTSVFSPDAREVMKNAINSARKAGASIVIHCSGGEGQAALGGGLCLVVLYGVSLEDAAREVEEQMKTNPSIIRRVNKLMLEYLITNRTMQGIETGGVLMLKSSDT